MTTFVVTMYKQGKIYSVFCYCTQHEAEEAANIFESNDLQVTLLASEENADDADFFQDAE